VRGHGSLLEFLCFELNGSVIILNSNTMNAKRRVKVKLNGSVIF